MLQRQVLQSLSSITIMAIVILFSSCEKGPTVIEKQDLNVTSTPKKIPPDAFLNAPSKSIFYWERNDFMCSQTDPDLTFKGMVYDKMDVIEREPIPYGDFNLVTKTIPPGPKDKAYKYSDNYYDTLEPQYYGGSLDVSLEDKQGNKVYETTVKVLGNATIACPDSCVSSNTCLSINETTFNSDFAALEVSGLYDENGNRVVNRKVLNTGGEGGLSQVCLDGLLDDFSAGERVEINLIRSKYYYITGIYGKMHKLASVSTTNNSFKVCQ
jgi:hypothetical protein